jgi:hypothetical protein
MTFGEEDDGAVEEGVVLGVVAECGEESEDTGR